MEGINIITDEKGNQKAIILDLLIFKKEGIKAETVLDNLKNLQELIDKAGIAPEKKTTWEAAKDKLSQLKDL
jgi:hypothetical protein